MDELIKEDIIIENMIYEIRGKQVMLDSDLAVLYQCANGTKTINQAVKRNIDRFPEDFYFQLTKDEYYKILSFQFETLEYEKDSSSILRSQFGTLELGQGKYSKYLPFVFTEQGVAMLATILKTPVAAQTSINIMRAFVSMRKYISNDYLEQKLLAEQVLTNTKEIHNNKRDIQLLQESFKKFEEKKVINEIYFNGQIYDAYSKILEIFKSATREIIVVDGYADKTLLDIIRNIDIAVKVFTYSKNDSFKILCAKYQKQYSNIKVVYDDTFHDRYFILDQTIVYHCGTSINHAGSKTFSINLLEDDIVKHALISRLT